MSEHAGPLAHHFEDIEQQKDAAALGMWAFLATEVLFFGGVLTTYTIYRYQYPREFAAASSLQMIGVGAVNTAVLLTLPVFAGNRYRLLHELAASQATHGRLAIAHGQRSWVVDHWPRTRDCLSLSTVDRPFERVWRRSGSVNSWTSARKSPTP